MLAKLNQIIIHDNEIEIEGNPPEYRMTKIELKELWENYKVSKCDEYGNSGSCEKGRMCGFFHN